MKETGKGPKKYDFTMLFLFLIVSLVALIARMFISHALPILQNSQFLFQFMMGAIIILFFSYVIGMNSYGFFSPMIIVISWLKLGPFWGFLVFFTIFTSGYVIRHFLSSYNLASGFRIGLVMIFVISVLGLLEILGETFRIDFLASTVLLPIIIVPAYIDQYTNDSEEKNQLEALKKLSSTLFITAICYIFMSYEPLVLFVVSNPETWVLIFGIAFYIGRTGKYTKFDTKRFSNIFNKQTLPLTLMVRNRDYIAKYNTKVLFPIINKMNLKEQFELWRVPSPELLAILNDERQIPNLINRIQNEDQFRNGFVIKPANSFGGRGILVIKERNNDNNFLIGDNLYHYSAIEKHLDNILHGEYLTSQIGSNNDIAIIEELIICNYQLQQISVGLPDIRVIVFRGIPVMAMSRLPTKESGGKANLKQGAIGAGIRLSDGYFFKSQFKGFDISNHPDTHNEIVGFQFNQDVWLNILTISCLAQKATGLGYAGVDLVVDKDDRVLVLEVNKRPGLEIQNINDDSILKRFKLVEEMDLDATELSPAKATSIGIELSKEYWEK